MDRIYQKFYDNIVSRALVAKGDGVLIALSGGSDSVFLLEAFLAVQSEFKLTIEAMHMDHNLRDDAQKDAAFSRRLCEEKGVMFHFISEDTKKYAKENKISTEDAGRRLRYFHLKEIAQKRNLSKTATAHHIDDNAETIIMRLIRGTSVNGLCGIPFKREDIIRPILNYSKDEIVDYLIKNEIPFVTDQSNYENDYLRNKVRNKIMPLLQNENPKTAEGFFRLSETARQYEDFANGFVDAITIKPYRQGVSADIGDLLKNHDLIVSKALIKMAELTGVDSGISFAHIASVLKLLKGDSTTWEADVCGVRFIRQYDDLIAAKQSDARETEDTDYLYPLNFACVHYLSKESLVIRTSIGKKTKKNIENHFIKVIDYDRIKGNLFVRNRKTGDFFYPLGLGGKKTLKKYMIDKKIPTSTRGKIPVITDDENIIAVGALAIDERYKISKETKRILKIEICNMGEPNEGRAEKNTYRRRSD